MSNWPATLPQEQFLGCSVGDDDSRVSSAMDAGPASVRNRFTAYTQSVKTNMILTGTQLEAFNTFYRTTLGHGVSSFTWTHPVDGSSVSMRFKAPPVWTAIRPDPTTGDRLWQATLDLEILPS